MPIFFYAFCMLCDIINISVCRGGSNMDKRIKMTEKEMCNYFIREQKVMDYGQEFFKELCGCSMSTPTCILINDEVIPLSCYNIMDEYLYSVEHDLDYAVKGGFVRACKKQAYIRIGIDTASPILNKKLKQTIRHEIIHYCLWLLDLPFEDNSLEFWCLCYVFDGGAYEKLSSKDNKYFELFKELYDTHVANLQWNMRHTLIGQMITGINKTSIDKYSDVVITMVNNIKNLYSLLK